jgi:DNA-binding response OmpR family regulator
MADDASAPPIAPRAVRALVVDDQPGIRRMVRRALGTGNVQVDEAGDGYEGLHRASSAAYDVVLLDLHLPGLDGMTVLGRLLSSKPHQAVIVSSCRSDRATRDECLRAGAREFLAKPFSLVDLDACFSASLEGSRGERPAG